MAFSRLITGSIRAKHSNSRNGTRVDSVAIHTMSGHLTGAQCGNYFANIGRVASSNYGIGYNGDIYGYVDEDLKSMCTSNSGVDRRAITIEVASETVNREPYNCSAAAYEALIRLLVDICQRHGMYLRWANDKAYAMAAARGGPVDRQNMFVHRWFNTGKSCPGQYLFERQGAIADEVNKRIKAGGGTIGPLPGLSSGAMSGGIEGKSTVVFIGDSRTVGMQAAVGSNNHIWSAKIGAGLSWMKSTGAPAVEDKINSSTGVCILMGINDFLGVKASDYSSYINQCATRWTAKGAAVYFVSINPVGSPSKGSYNQITNDKISEYNQQVRNGLNTNVGYIDTFSQILNNFKTVDGLHYDKDTYSAIYSAITSAVQAGQAGMYCDSACIGGMPAQIDYMKLNSYVITLDRNSPDDIDFDKLQENRVVGAVIEGGYLYYPDSSVQVPVFKQPKFDAQKKAIENKNLEWGFFFTIRSTNIEQAISEMYEITLMLRHYPCRFGVWLKLELKKDQVETNDKILLYFQKQLIRLGFMAKIGFYVDKDRMDTFTWDKFKDMWLLWIVNHVEDTADIQKLLDPSFFDMDGDNADDKIFALTQNWGSSSYGYSSEYGYADSTGFGSTYSGSPALGAMNWAIRTAEDDSHGYSQKTRFGPDYDCSGLVISAYRQVGIDLTTYGVWASASMIDSRMLKAGFVNVTGSCNMRTAQGIQQGDILWRSGHVAMYIGDGRIVEASSPRGHSETGDQTGTEVKTCKFRTEFTKVYRYMGASAETVSTTTTISSKDTSSSVKTLKSNKKIMASVTSI